LTTEQKTLARIRTALQRKEGGAPPPLPRFVDTRVERSPDELKPRLLAEMKRVSANAIGVSSIEEVEQYVEGLLPSGIPKTVAVSDSPALGNIRVFLLNRGVTLLPTLKEFAAAAGGSGDTREKYKRELLAVDLGVTCADYALADTGTLVLVSGGEQHRMISLVPPVHVCLLSADRIVPDLAALITRVGGEMYSRGSAPNAMTFITGPSRTADIELSLTLGVHGPRELHVLVIG
jgi:L-lactate dehydrogenase complex protein LldG